MIVVPTSPEQVDWCKAFLEKRGGFVVSQWAHFLIWEKGGVPTWIVAFDDWVGSTCQLHMVSQPNAFLTKTFIEGVFQHAFWALKRSHVFGVVNSFNKKAMKIDLWLGFEEILRVYGAHDEGGDIVLLQMTPAKCRWLKEKDYGKARAAGS